ncbi:hypothetical protein LguiA_001682 [Lonicera macranthoides]
MEEDENAVHFANGWQDFVKENSLQEGEFLVLRYNGSSSFTVRIFGKDVCMKDNYLAMEKIATANIKSEAASETESEAASTDTQNSPKIPEKSRGSFQLSGHKKSRKRLMNQRFSLTAADVKIEDGALKAAYELISSSKHPTFKVIMPQTYLERNYMDIPPSFVQRHMKKDTKWVELLIKNKSWPVNLTSPQRNRICKGWRKCQRGNSFQVGDVCVFELIDRDKPVLKVSIFKS